MCGKMDVMVSNEAHVLLYSNDIMQDDADARDEIVDHLKFFVDHFQRVLFCDSFLFFCSPLQQRHFASLYCAKG